MLTRKKPNEAVIQLCGVRYAFELYNSDYTLRDLVLSQRLEATEEERSRVTAFVWHPSSELQRILKLTNVSMTLSSYIFIQRDSNPEYQALVNAGGGFRCTRNFSLRLLDKFGNSLENYVWDFNNDFTFGRGYTCLSILSRMQQLFINDSSATDLMQRIKESSTSTQIEVLFIEKIAKAGAVSAELVYSAYDKVENFTVIFSKRVIPISIGDRVPCSVFSPWIFQARNLSAFSPIAPADQGFVWDLDGSLDSVLQLEVPLRSSLFLVSPSIYGKSNFFTAQEEQSPVLDVLTIPSALITRGSVIEIGPSYAVSKYLTSRGQDLNGVTFRLTGADGFLLPWICHEYTINIKALFTSEDDLDA